MLLHTVNSAMSLQTFSLQLHLQNCKVSQEFEKKHRNSEVLLQQNSLMYILDYYQPMFPSSHILIFYHYLCKE